MGGSEKYEGLLYERIRTEHLSPFLTPLITFSIFQSYHPHTETPLTPGFLYNITLVRDTHRG